MSRKEIELMLAGHGLTTAQIYYRMPDFKDVLQTYLWQDYDLARSLLAEAGHAVVGVYVPPDSGRPDPLAAEAEQRKWPLFRHRYFRRKGGEAIASRVAEYQTLGAELNVMPFTTAILPREIVDAHGGMISVESEQGVGSTFRVELPASDHVTNTINAAARFRPGLDDENEATVGRRA